MAENFKPVVGMTTTDSYLHGIGELLDYVGMPGKIEYVAYDYFILRLENGKAMFVDEDQYWCISENDFK